MKKNLILLQLLPIATVIASCGGGGGGGSSSSGVVETPTYSCVTSEITRDAASTYLHVYNSCPNDANISNVLIGFPVATEAEKPEDVIKSLINGTFESGGSTAVIRTEIIKPYVAMTQLSGILSGNQSLYFALPTNARNLDINFVNSRMKTMPNIVFESAVPSYLDGKFNNTLMGIQAAINPNTGNPYLGAYSMKLTNNSGFTLSNFNATKYSIAGIGELSINQFTAYNFNATETQDCASITSLGAGNSCYLGVQYTPAKAGELGEVTFRISGTAFESYIGLDFSSK